MAQVEENILLPVFVFTRVQVRSQSTAETLTITAQSAQNPAVKGSMTIHINHGGIRIYPEEVWISPAGGTLDPEKNGNGEVTYHADILRSIGSRQKPETVAANLYRILREFDDLECDYMYSESFFEQGLGNAIMNRMLKAAGYHLITL